MSMQIFGGVKEVHYGIVQVVNKNFFFLLFSFVYMVIVKTENRSSNKKYTESLTAKLQNSNQISIFSWVSFIRFRTPRALELRF